MDPETVSIVLTRGTTAKALMNSEVFVAAMQDLENYHVTAMVACLPGDGEKATRDHHHLLLFALREIASQLAGYVQAGDEVGKALEEPDLEDEL